MTGRVSLVEQKRLQWAKEREEMAKLNGHWESMKNATPVRSTIRTRLSSKEVTGSQRKPIRVNENYSSTASLRSFETGSTSLKSLDFSAGGSMINILERIDYQGTVRKRSPSLPPINTKEHQHHHHHHIYSSQELSGLEVEGSRYTNRQGGQKHPHCESDQNTLPQCNTYEEREGETSGYASDSIEQPRGIQMSDGKKLIPLDKNQIDNELSDRQWQNLYAETSDTSLPSSRRFTTTRLNELNRPRWGSIWNQDNHHSDPPPPSWLERGLSRLDHSSQILVINHDSASSPDNSTTGSMGSDTKTYLRGQNIPVDAHILQEREMKRQRALELQNAIKQQLEEKDKKRKEDREKKLREEREEEERIKRERDKEKERLEEEQKRQKEREDAKIKKEMAMKEILENAERLAREEKRQKRQREDCSERVNDSGSREIRNIENPIKIEETLQQKKAIHSDSLDSPNEKMENNSEKCDKINEEEIRENHIRLPLNKEVAIVLTGRLENSEFLNGKNLQLLNLIVNSSQIDKNNSGLINSSINAIFKDYGNDKLCNNSTETIYSPRIIQNRLLTPSKYRGSNGRDFGTQTDGENENYDADQKDCMKDRKEIVNNSRRDAEKGTTTGSTDEKMSRSKSQPRPSLDSRPRWNANRPGTRYRTQSEKDPHYQKRLRLRRRRIESSDERSRSPSPDRRKSINIKSKNRNSTRRKVKLESYDADLSMDSLNSVLPLRIDENGRINIELNDDKCENSYNSRDCQSLIDKIDSNEKVNLWCSDEILSQLAALRNGLLLKQQEWETERCLVSPNTEFL